MNDHDVGAKIVGFIGMEGPPQGTRLVQSFSKLKKKKVY